MLREKRGDHGRNCGSRKKGRLWENNHLYQLSRGDGRKRKNSLLVDLDPQGSLGRCLGGAPGQTQLSEVLSHQGEGFKELIEGVNIEPPAATGAPKQGELMVVPADKELALIDKGLDNTVGREFLLRKALDQLDGERFDYCLIDCPPSLGYMASNALVAADWVLLPLDTSTFGLQAAADTLRLVLDVQQVLNPSLSVLGLLVNNVKSFTLLEKELLSQLRSPPPDGYGKLVLKTVIPISVKVKEAVDAGLPYVRYDPKGRKSRLAGVYRQLADEIQARLK